MSLLLAVLLAAKASPVVASVEAIEPSLEPLYQDLHRTPELSLQEEKTSAKLAERLRALGFAVTAGVGGHGVVGVLRNGNGPTVLLRTEMDALPVKEETGLAWASTITAVDPGGATVPVMHACGHDLHMTSWVGAATFLSRSRDRWHGTLVMMGQPAEEIFRGAKAMIDDGLLTRFPKPDFALTLHVTPTLPTGQIAAQGGPAYAANNSVEMVVHGRGGHGASPQRTVDPVLLASRIVVALQGIVARENNPLDPAVITVGSIHGGTKANIIPDEVKLQITVRSFRPEVQKRLLDAIARVARGEAQASGAPKEPTITVQPGVLPTVNDPAVAARVRAAVSGALGPGAVAEFPPVMASEDFSEIGHAGVPAVVAWLGTSPDAASAEAARSGAAPGVHTSRFAPEPAPALRTGIATLTTAALELFAKR